MTKPYRRLMVTICKQDIIKQMHLLFLIEIFIFLCMKKVFFILHDMLQALENDFLYLELVLHQLFCIFYLIASPTQCVYKTKDFFPV